MCGQRHWQRRRRGAAQPPPGIRTLLVVVATIVVVLCHNNKVVGFGSLTTTTTRRHQNHHHQPHSRSMAISTTTMNNDRQNIVHHKPPICYRYRRSHSVYTLTFHRAMTDDDDDDSSRTDMGDNNHDDDPFMASLKTRMDQVTDRDTKLPIIILDAMLPRQILNVTIPSDALLIRLIKRQITNETPYFGMLGLIRSRSRPQQLLPLTTGTQVDIISKPKVIHEDDGTTSIQILLKGSHKRFKINQEVVTTPEGWMEARVDFLTLADDETACLSRTTTDRYALARAMASARVLPDLIQEWIKEARTKERFVGQINALLHDIGPVPPPPDEPTNLSFYVGALINPLPALGVALEIRPSLLLADTPEERVQLAIQGITKSIRHMRGEPLLS